MGGGAWPFLVGGAICLVNSDNERDSSLLNSSGTSRCRRTAASVVRLVVHTRPRSFSFLEGQVALSHARLSNNRSVMPLDVRGRTCATMNGATSALPGPKGFGNLMNPVRNRDWGLKLFPMNEEFPVGASHQLASITSLPFVHTARRYYRSLQLMSSSDRSRGRLLTGPTGRRAEKMRKLTGVEEVKVVTRYP